MIAQNDPSRWPTRKLKRLRRIKKNALASYLAYPERLYVMFVAGVYVFHFHAYSTNRDAVMWLELLHNDAVTVSLSGYNSHTVASNTVMLKLRQNDRVEVRSKEQQQFSLFGLPDQVYSTFTGYLLSPDTTGTFMDSGDLVG